MIFMGNSLDHLSPHPELMCLYGKRERGSALWRGQDGKGLRKKHCLFFKNGVVNPGMNMMPTLKPLYSVRTRISDFP